MATINRQQVITFFTQTLLRALDYDPVLASLFNNANMFVQPGGAYKIGQSIDIQIANKSTATFKKDFTTNNPRTPAKGEFTNFNLELDTLAIIDLLYDQIDNVFTSVAMSSGGITNSTQVLIQQRLQDLVEGIEEELYLNTFNLASLDAQTLGTSGNAFTFNDIENLRKIFSSARWKGRPISLVLPPDMYTQLRIDFRGAYTNLAPGQINVRDGFVLNDLPNITVYEAIETPTVAEMTNITGADTTPMGFAFANDAIALFNPTLNDTSRNIGVESFSVSEGNYNLEVTSETDNSKEFKEDNSVMRGIYGSVIYRPSLVFPIKGGNIS